MMTHTFAPWAVPVMLSEAKHLASRDKGQTLRWRSG